MRSKGLNFKYFLREPPIDGKLLSEKKSGDRIQETGERREEIEVMSQEAEEASTVAIVEEVPEPLAPSVSLLLSPDFSPTTPDSSFSPQRRTFLRR